MLPTSRERERSAHVSTKREERERERLTLQISPSLASAKPPCQSCSAHTPCFVCVCVCVCCSTAEREREVLAHVFFKTCRERERSRNVFFSFFPFPIWANALKCSPTTTQQGSNLCKFSPKFPQHSHTAKQILQYYTLINKLKQLQILSLRERVPTTEPLAARAGTVPEL